MLCKNCGKKQATTHIMRTVNGKTEEYFLCGDCAIQFGVASFNSFDISDLWGSLFGPIEHHGSGEQLRCKSCNSSFNDIARSGKLGCPDCYKTFYDQLLPSLQKLHGKTHHVGKVPDNADCSTKSAYRLKNLKEELKLAIDDEQYEKAAKIRDEIREIETGGKCDE